MATSGSTAVMVANQGAEAKKSWFYDAATPETINTMLAQNHAQLVCIQNYGPGTFTVVMEELLGQTSFWYFDKTKSDLDALAKTNNAKSLTWRLTS